MPHNGHLLYPYQRQTRGELATPSQISKDVTVVRLTVELASKDGVGPASGTESLGSASAPLAALDAESETA